MVEHDWLRERKESRTSRGGERNCAAVAVAAGSNLGDTERKNTVNDWKSWRRSRAKKKKERKKKKGCVFIWREEIRGCGIEWTMTNRRCWEARPKRRSPSHNHRPRPTYWYPSCDLIRRLRRRRPSRSCIPPTTHNSPAWNTQRREKKQKMEKEPSNVFFFAHVLLCWAVSGGAASSWDRRLKDQSPRRLVALCSSPSLYWVLALLFTLLGSALTLLHTHSTHWETEGGKKLSDRPPVSAQLVRLPWAAHRHHSRSRDDDQNDQKTIFIQKKKVFNSTVFYWNNWQSLTVWVTRNGIQLIT